MYLYRRLSDTATGSFGMSAEDMLFENLTAEEVKDAVEALPTRYREAVLLSDVHGFSYKEIAEILDIPQGTVMSRLHRGRAKLQKELLEFATRSRLVTTDTLSTFSNSQTAREPESVGVGDRT